MHVVTGKIGWSLWNFAEIFGIRKLQSLGYRMACLRDRRFSGLIEHRLMTDGRTHDNGKNCSSIASRGKNSFLVLSFVCYMCYEKKMILLLCPCCCTGCRCFYFFLSFCVLCVNKRPLTYLLTYVPVLHHLSCISSQHLEAFVPLW